MPNEEPYVDEPKVVGPTRADFEAYQNRGVNTGMEYGPTREDFEKNEYEKEERDLPEHDEQATRLFGGNSPSEREARDSKFAREHNKRVEQELKEAREEEDRIKREEDESYTRARREQKEREVEDASHEQTMYKLQLQEREALAHVGSKAKVARIQSQMREETKRHSNPRRGSVYTGAGQGLPNSLGHERGYYFNVPEPHEGGNKSFGRYTPKVGAAHVGKTPRMGSFGSSSGNTPKIGTNKFREGGKMPTVGSFGSGKVPTIGLHPSNTQLSKTPAVKYPTIGGGLNLNTNSIAVVGWGKPIKKSTKKYDDIPTLGGNLMRGGGIKITGIGGFGDIPKVGFMQGGKVPKIGILGVSPLGGKGGVLPSIGNFFGPIPKIGNIGRVKKVANRKRRKK